MALIAVGAIAGPRLITRSEAAPASAPGGIVWDAMPDFADISDPKFRDLGAPGPTVVVTVGESGTVRVTLSATISSSGDTFSGGMMSFAMSGTNTSEASSDRALSYSVSGASWTTSASRTIVLTGLTPGPTTFTAQYASSAAGILVGFSDRMIEVQVL